MKSLVASLILTSLALGAQAQTPATPRFDQREAHQEMRIDQGVASGALTQQETTRLQNQQARIQTMEDRAKADGQVTKRERAKLHAAQDHASHSIARKKHNQRGG